MVLQCGMGLRKLCFIIDIERVQCRNIKEEMISGPDVITDKYALAGVVFYQFCRATVYS